MPLEVREGVGLVGKGTHVTWVTWCTEWGYDPLGVGDVVPCCVQVRVME